MPGTQTYSGTPDISPRTTAKVAAGFLRRGIPIKVTEQFGTPYTLGKNETKSVTFRRYNSLAAPTVPLVEGVTPAGSKISKVDFTATLREYGDYVKFSNVIIETHEDPVAQQAMEILGEQGAECVERDRIGILQAGTNVYYSNGATRVAVNTAFGIGTQRAVVRGFKRQNAKMLTDINKGSTTVGTLPVEAGFFAVAHVDLENDIRALTDFTTVAEYGSGKGVEGEIGQAEGVRYVLSNLVDAWPDAGAAGATMIGTTNPAVAVDVYPILFFARDAFQTVVLGGMNSITVKMTNPVQSDSDPLGQRAIVAWRTYTTTIITNDNWMARVETAATELA